MSLKYKIFYILHIYQGLYVSETFIKILSSSMHQVLFCEIPLFKPASHHNSYRYKYMYCITKEHIPDVFKLSDKTLNENEDVIRIIFSH